MIFNELRKHGRLAAKRHPMYEKNKVAKILGYVMGAFWAGYLIFFGTTFAFGFSDMVPNREPYHVMNAVVLIFILALDFLLRVPFQKTPTQEVKPYLLLPVKRIRVIDFLLIRSGLSLFNLFWLFLFVPFSFITITKFFDIPGRADSVPVLSKPLRYPFRQTKSAPLLAVCQLSRLGNAVPPSPECSHCNFHHGRT